MVDSKIQISQICKRSPATEKLATIFETHTSASSHFHQDHLATFNSTTTSLSESSPAKNFCHFQQIFNILDKIFIKFLQDENLANGDNFIAEFESIFVEAVDKLLRDEVAGKYFREINLVLRQVLDQILEVTGELQPLIFENLKNKNFETKRILNPVVYLSDKDRIFRNPVYSLWQYCPTYHRPRFKNQTR